MTPRTFSNPFRPGAGHKPPYLAGRAEETDEFRRLLGQDVILENMVLTGLRGAGKTVLLDTLKPIAIADGWHWVGTDLSESSSITEERMVLRLLTDLSIVTSSLQIGEMPGRVPIGFAARGETEPVRLDFRTLSTIYDSTPGLPADKLKAVLDVVWAALKLRGARGLVFAYDEAQNLADHAEKTEYPLSLLLDVFQSVQKRDIPFLLLLVGLPTLFPKLVEARTFAERMFRVVFLDRLSDEESRQAILKPIEQADCPVRLDEASIDSIVTLSGGYPYFIQFICREVYDAWLQGQTRVPLTEITRKLDSDFFAGRWARATDRQRDLLLVIARLPRAGQEFTVAEIAEESRQRLTRPFSPSHISQMLAVLAQNGLIYKNRHGKYSFAVPLLDRFLLRQLSRADEPGGSAQGAFDL
jgi:hypothetical protein